MVLSQWSAPSERADVCSNHLVYLTGIPDAEAEKISLLFQILGWSVAVPDALHGPARLTMRAVGNIIEVAIDDGGILPTLAAAGLDRLVMPVPLPALEQLMVFAG
jgi:hypothetical protein